MNTFPDISSHPCCVSPQLKRDYTYPRTNEKCDLLLFVWRATQWPSCAPPSCGDYKEQSSQKAWISQGPGPPSPLFLWQSSCLGQFPPCVSALSWFYCFNVQAGGSQRRRPLHAKGGSSRAPGTHHPYSPPNVCRDELAIFGSREPSETISPTYRVSGSLASAPPVLDVLLQLLSACTRPPVLRTNFKNTIWDLAVQERRLHGTSLVFFFLNFFLVRFDPGTVDSVVEGAIDIRSSNSYAHQLSSDNVGSQPPYFRLSKSN